MSETVKYTKKWYIAVQDGRYDDRDFDTPLLADKARHQLPPFDRNTTCIMSYLKEEKV